MIFFNVCLQRSPGVSDKQAMQTFYVFLHVSVTKLMLVDKVVIKDVLRALNFVCKRLVTNVALKMIFVFHTVVSEPEVVAELCRGVGVPATPVASSRPMSIHCCSGVWVRMVINNFTPFGLHKIAATLQTLNLVFWIHKYKLLDGLVSRMKDRGELSGVSIFLERTDSGGQHTGCEVAKKERQQTVQLCFGTSGGFLEKKLV